MMDERQRAAAERALRKVELDEIRKRIALQRRKWCMENISFFLLPYRVLFNLHQPPEQIELNRFYPYRACTAATEAEISEAIKHEREQAGGISDERLGEIRISIESRDYTPESERERLFTCFLFGWDFSGFKIWDWTGCRIPESEADRLRRYYTERQGRYEDCPDRFALPALKADDDMGRYSPEMQELLRTLDSLDDYE